MTLGLVVDFRYRLWKELPRSLISALLSLGVKLRLRLATAVAQDRTSPRRELVFIPAAATHSARTGGARDATRQVAVRAGCRAIDPAVADGGPGR